MNRLLLGYVGAVDAMNRRLGRLIMYGLFAMMGILAWSIISKATDTPSLWTLEMAQFAMVAYYILGGPYAMQMGANVRMDLFYGSWSDRRKAWVDAFTVFFLIFYLAVLLRGAIGSMAYALGHFGGEPFAFFAGLAGALVGAGPDAAAEELGFLERAPTAWRPYLWPIKAVLVVGFFLMLLQAFAELAKDILRIRGHDIPRESI